jgi:hypothetical protein
MHFDPYTEAEVNKMPLIMGFLNKYTNRWVSIHRHPEDINKVVTMSYPKAANGGVAMVIPRVRVIWKDVAEWFIGKLPDGC